jgi:uncharacterized protein YcbK (DUF882 family)
MDDYITPHFTWSEFACHNGVPVPDELKQNVIDLCGELERIRAIFDRPIIILCGYRTQAYNDMLRKSDPLVALHSEHILGKAADIQIPPFNSITVRDKILYMINTIQILQGGLGLYDNFVHYDIRGGIARWDYRTKK